MPRTRDLLVVVVSLLLTFLLWMIYIYISPVSEAVESVPSTQTVLLSTPKDSYEVVPYEKDSLRDGRDAFIEKVRQTYIAPIQLPPAAESVPFISEFETPPAVVSPTPTVSTTTPIVVPVVVPIATTTVVSTTPPYGNTGI